MCSWVEWRIFSILPINPYFNLKIALKQEDGFRKKEWKTIYHALVEQRDCFILQKKNDFKVITDSPKIVKNHTGSSRILYPVSVTCTVPIVTSRKP